MKHRGVGGQRIFGTITQRDNGVQVAVRSRTVWEAITQRHEAVAALSDELADTQKDLKTARLERDQYRAMQERPRVAVSGVRATWWFRICRRVFGISWQDRARDWTPPAPVVRPIDLEKERVARELERGVGLRA